MAYAAPPVLVAFWRERRAATDEVLLTRSADFLGSALGRYDMVKRQRLLTLATGLACCIAASAASAAVDKVICVPWQGDVNKQHTIISGQAAQLKCVVKTTDISNVYTKWVFGDGVELAGPTLSGGTKYNVETTHVYTAANGTPFTAKLQVSNTTPFAMSKEDPVPAEDREQRHQRADQHRNRYGAVVPVQAGQRLGRLCRPSAHL